MVLQTEGTVDFSEYRHSQDTSLHVIIKYTVVQKQRIQRPVFLTAKWPLLWLHHATVARWWLNLGFPLTQPSTSSRFYVLHDWESTYSQEENTAPLPAAKISDIMLKTMGILKVSLLYYTVFYSLAYNNSNDRYWRANICQHQLPTQYTAYFLTVC